MAYLNPDKFIFEDDNDPKDFIDDVTYRKEFAMYARPYADSADKKYKKLYDLSGEISKGNYLFPHVSQQFQINYFNPSTENTRMLSALQTGAGKSVPVLKIALNLLDYQSKAHPESMGHIIILGFSHATFKRQLLQYPEFGFLSRDELREYQNLQKQALNGGNLQQLALHEFILRIKRRLTSKTTHRARFVFMGYKQFANRLFVKNTKYDQSEYNGSRSISLSSSDDPIIVPTTVESINITAMNEEEIKDAIATGKVTINSEIVELFRNSFIICDEVHKIYNSEEKNNWGIAINTIMNMPELKFRVVFLSATPINNNPTEIVDLLNLLIPPPHNGVKREDLFVPPNFVELKPGALHTIGKLTAGRVSFLQDQNPKFYPKRVLHGEYIKGVPMLKFIRCPMSKFHYKTYKSVYTGAIQQESQNLIDFVLPDPTNEDIGMYQSSQIISKLSHAPLEWKQKHGIDYYDGTIVGNIMDARNIGKYSAKYERLLLFLSDFVTTRKSGKIFIYHDAVYISGIIFIQELLKQNGYLDEIMAPSDDTLCSICGATRAKHARIDKVAEETVADISIETEDIQLSNLVQVLESVEGGARDKKINDHIYMPIRFIVAHSDIDKGYLHRNLEKFNHPDNHYGEHIRIIIGSQLMKESHDMTMGRKCIIVRRPENIATLIQIMGRMFRNSSHRGAPPEECVVEYYILTSSCPDGSLGYEEEMYKKKIEQYQMIQKIQRMMHIYAIDSAINYEKISKIFTSKDSLGTDILPYKPIISFNAKRAQQEADTSTYNILYAESEVDMIVGFIKRAFIEWSPVWTFDDLWKFISSDRSPMSNDVNIRLSMLSKEYFAAALDRLVRSTKTIGVGGTSDFMDRIFDPHSKEVIYPNVWGSSVAHIKMIGDYYILCPDGRTDPDLQYRHKSSVQSVKRISLDTYINGEVSMSDEWDDFVSVNSGKKFEELDVILCSYSLDFHEYIIRKIVMELNRKMSFTDTTEEKPYWELSFYVRLLLTYDIMGIIIWGSHDEHFNDQYKQWITPPCGFSSVRSCSTLLSDLSKEAKGTKCSWCPANILSMYYSKMKLLLNIVAARGFAKQKKKAPGKIDASLYPVGYCLRKGFLYNPMSDGWREYAPPVSRIPENDLIIGYDERADEELVVRFKLRNPAHKIVRHKDVRRLEKGTACSSKSKEYLIDMADKLGLGSDDKNNVQVLCGSIRSQLIYNEIMERQKPINNRKRWFYYVYEIHE